METPSGMPPAGAAAQRRIRRHAAGLRAAWLWGGVLIALALIFAALYLALDARREKAWVRAMTAALQREDAAECAALLAACRRDQPDLAKHPSFAVWESRCLALTQRREARHTAFETKIAALEQALAAPEHHAAIDWPQALAEAARLADAEADLARLRTLRLHSEARSRSAKLARSAAVARELAAARKDLQKLAELRKSSDFEALAPRREALHHTLEALRLKTQDDMDLAEGLRRLTADFQAENAAAQKAEKAFFEEEKAAHAVAAGTNAEEIARRIQDFRVRFPESPRNAMFQELAAELELQRYPFREELERNLTISRERMTQALAVLRHDWAVIQGEYALTSGAAKAQLDALDQILQRLDAATLPAWLDAYTTPADVPWSAPLDAAVARTRRTLEPEADQLHVPAGAWHTLQDTLWREAVRHTPVFAGLLERGEFRPAGFARRHSDVWLVEPAGDPPRFIRAGTLNGSEFSDEVGVNSILRSLWVPTGDWPAARRRQELEAEAQKLGAPEGALTFPVFWVK